MPWPWFAHRFPRRLVRATDADFRRMAWNPSRFAPHPSELLQPDPWVPPTGDPATVLTAFGAKDVVWEGGVPVAASLTGRAFVSGGEVIYRVAPLRSVRLVAVDPVRGELPGCPHLAKLHRLDLWGCQLGPDVRALAESPHLSGLKELNLSRNDLGDEEAVAVAESPYLAALQKLDVADNPRLTDTGAELLLRRFGGVISR
jgi:hypothetical protein